MLVVALGLLGVADLLRHPARPSASSSGTILEALVGLSFGASLISIFARLGGGIFTKGADVGADLVGKVEAGIPEDDPRNPAVIADNVGDNVGDCAGMAADLFETYAVTIVATMLLGAIFFTGTQAATLMMFPLVIGGVCLLASIAGTYLVKLGPSNNIMGALYKGFWGSAAISAVVLLPVTALVLGLGTGYGDPATTSARPGCKLYYCSLVGLGVTGLLMWITDYYTGINHRPVLSIAKSSTTGHGTNIIQGLAVSMEATALPVLVICAGILIAYLLGRPVRHRHRRHDHAGAGRPRGRARRLRPGHRQCRRHRRDGGPAARGPRPHRRAGRGRQHHQGGHQGLRDRLGRPRRAGAVRRLRRRTSSTTSRSLDVQFSCPNPYVVVGLFIGGMLPYLFGAMGMQAVGRAAGAIVEEVRRQFREKPGIMAGTDKPDYGTRGRHADQGRHPRDDPPLAAAGAGADRGLLRRSRAIAGQAEAFTTLGAMLLGTIVTGIFVAISMTSGGGAWDNAKKYIEEGNYGGKGSEAHKAAVTGDTVGDPYKDTAGPADQPDDQDHQHRGAPDPGRLAAMGG